jgi:hypothetical protein
MKGFKTSIHLFIATSSAAGCLAGWALLAHSPKPAQTVQQTVQRPAQIMQVTTIPSLAPLQPLPPMPAFGTATNNAQPLTFEPQPLPQPQPLPLPTFRSRLRTGGS